MIPAGHGQAGGVVFDCDGVLADTMGCWEEAFCAVGLKLGLVLGQDQLKRLRGAALATAARRIASWSCRPMALDDVLEALAEHLMNAIATAQLVLIEGARELLEELHGMVRLGVASNSPRPVLLRVLDRLDITGFFAAAISADDVARPKPAPGVASARHRSQRTGQHATCQFSS